MSLIQKISSSIFLKLQTILLLVALLAVFGTLLELSGGIWDAVSHIMREPEFFWTIQHVTVYTGVAMIGSSGILASFILFRKSIEKNLKKGIIIIIIGAIIQISAGYADSISHDVFGIDGLLSWSHQPLEAGLVISAFGGFMVMSNIEGQKFKKILPLSIITLIFSTSWIGFNLSLLIGSTILCIPIYQMFSSGCAVL